MSKESKDSESKKSVTDKAKEMFTPDAKSRLADESFSVLEEAKQEIEQQKAKETKSGRKSKDAKIAEQSEVWSEILQPVLMGINKGVTRYAEELAHTDEEIQTIAVLSGKILPKYVDFDMLQYKDETMLISYLVMIETSKIQNYLANRENTEESTRSDNGVGKAGKRKDTPNKNATDS